MGENSKIEWTTHTFNPWIGCTKVHAGCTHCYAESFAMRYGKATWGPNGTRVLTTDTNWRKPAKWNRDQAAWLQTLRDDQDGRAEPVEVTDVGPHRPRVFCASLADVFEDWKGRIVNAKGETLHRGDAWHSKQRYIAPGVEIGKSVATMNDLRRDLFTLIDATPHLDWLLLTKRPENIRRMWPKPINAHPYGSWEQIERHRALAKVIPIGRDRDAADEAGYRPNVWLLTSVSDQETADRMVPELLKCRDLVPVLGLSCEPLVGPVDLNRAWSVAMDEQGWHPYHDNLNDCPNCNAGENQDDSGFDCSRCHGTTRVSGIDWVIVGGESGSGARPYAVEWAQSIIAQTKSAGVACFHKQLGVFPVEGHPVHPPGGKPFYTVNNKVKLADKKGGDWSEWPEDLRVRQFPVVQS